MQLRAHRTSQPHRSTWTLTRGQSSGKFHTKKQRFLIEISEMLKPKYKLIDDSIGLCISKQPVAGDETALVELAAIPSKTVTLYDKGPLKHLDFLNKDVSYSTIEFETMRQTTNSHILRVSRIDKMENVGRTDNRYDSRAWKIWQRWWPLLRHRPQNCWVDRKLDDHLQ